MEKQNNLCGIYMIVNTANNKKYIGHSINIKKRWKQHKINLNRNVSKNTHLQKAWLKYGKDSFMFSVIELLPCKLTRQEYEEVETKWVLHFKSHLSEFGYNGVLPGSIPLSGEKENKTKMHKGGVKYVCLHKGGEKLLLFHYDIVHTLNISSTKVIDLSNYWRGKGRRKSLYGWMIIRESEYDENFDYLSFKKIRPKVKTWKEYYEKNKEKYRLKNKVPVEKQIPYSERNLKRVSIIAVNIITGEEILYPMFRSCAKDFLLAKVRKCINNEFGKYQHRGHYFKRAG